MENNVLIQVRDLSKSFGELEVLKSVSVDIKQGEKVVIVGASGSGKSTLLRCLNCLEDPTGGEVICEGVSTAALSLDRYRREKVAVIYQSFRLFPLLTVAENVMYPMELRGMKTKAARAKAALLIARVGLPESVLDRYPTMLSGGEQQRVAIARALGMDTGILLADEPTGNLDTANSENIASLLCRLAHEEGYCVIIVTHDMDLAAKADEILELCDGEVVA